MGQRTDTRQRIIAAALNVMRKKGFRGAAISDIVQASGAPRGSVTFHFPGGKDEIADEVIALRTSQVLAGLDDVASRASSAADLLSNLVNRIAKDFGDSDYTLGCPVLPIALDRSAESTRLREASRTFYASWRAQLARHLRTRGVPQQDATRIATLTISAIEGALVIGRLEQTGNALRDVKTQVRRLVT